MAKVTSITSVYPMDSLMTIGDDGLPVYDRAYNASDLAEVIGAFLSNGVFTAAGDALSVTSEDGTWSVGTGGAVAGHRIIPVDSPAEVIDQDEIGTGQYAYIIIALRNDTKYRDGAIYSVLSESPTYSPIRNNSTWELVLARIDWRGGLSDYRLDNLMCGPVTPFAEIDTDQFMLELHTAVSQFNLNVGEVRSIPSGSTPVVTVRKPEMAGGDVYIDFDIPRGAPGKDGTDGDSAPTMYISPESEEPPKVYGNTWLVDDKETHTINDIRCYETEKVYPSDTLFPNDTLFPGGTGQWVSHKLAASLMESQESEGSQTEQEA